MLCNFYFTLIAAAGVCGKVQFLVSCSGSDILRKLELTLI
jgi:hypothetical protein